jgi:hypothetical protein
MSKVKELLGDRRRLPQYYSPLNNRSLKIMKVPRGVLPYFSTNLLLHAQFLEREAGLPCVLSQLQRFSGLAFCTGEKKILK